MAALELGLNQAEHLLPQLLRDSWELVAVDCRRSSGSSPNRCWFVTTSQGRWVVRRWEPTCDPDWITHQSRHLVRLARSGLPVSPPIACDDGASFAEAAGHRWQLFPYIPGERPQLGLASCVAQSAVALARLHALPGEALAPADSGFDDWLAEPTHTRRRLSAVLRSAVSTRDRGRAEVCYASVVDWIGVRLTGLYAQLPRRLIHGDFHGGNLIFEREKLRAIIDWETMATAARATDVGYAALMSARLDRSEFRIDGTRLRAFVAAYAQAGSIGADELAACLPLAALRFVLTPTFAESLARAQRLEAFLAWHLPACQLVCEQVKQLLDTVFDGLEGARC